jgi:ATP-dependent Clp protease ATP-binding subunit ClpX
VIASRVGNKTLGFGAEVRSKQERDQEDLFLKVLPQDLLRFGLIPELVGRLPVVAPLHGLDEAALVDILVKPKNALVKQYRKLFEMEDIQLEFDPGAIRAIARLALKRATGARGLRSIMEETMLDLMYELPSRPGVQRVVIAEDTVTEGKTPKIFFGDERQIREA